MKNIQIKYSISIAACNFLLLGAYSASSPAEDKLLINPRVEIGLVDYSIDFDGTVPTPVGFRDLEYFFAIHPISYRFGLTASYQGYFFDGYYQTTSEDTVTQVFAEQGAIINWTSKKREFNIAIGTTIYDLGYCFIGYRNHEQTAIGTSNSDYEFSHEGIFVGGGYAWPITSTGSISLNAGYAWLDAVIKESLFGNTVPEGTGSTSGIKFGFVWRDQITSDIGYSISYDQYSYNHRLRNRKEGVDVRVREKDSSIRVGLNLIF